jgi:hypothetical protein
VLVNVLGLSHVGDYVIGEISEISVTNKKLKLMKTIKIALIQMMIYFTFNIAYLMFNNFVTINFEALGVDGGFPK